MNKKRFLKVYSQKDTIKNELMPSILETTTTEILVDKETGVNYLFCSVGTASGLTVLVNQDGRPIVTPIEES